MIKAEKLFIPELKANFRVIEVDWEPISESTWTLQYEDYPIFMAYNLNATKEEHEKLAGQEIEACIDICVYKGVRILKKEKDFSSKDGFLKVTGQVDDIIEFSIESRDKTIQKYIEYKLNSVFPVIISRLPKGAKLGDWVTIEGEAYIDFPWS